MVLTSTHRVEKIAVPGLVVVVGNVVVGVVVVEVVVVVDVDVVNTFSERNI